jgi:hypothetical protein
MTKLLKKNDDFNWTEECQSSFEEATHFSTSVDSTEYNQDVRHLL